MNPCKGLAGIALLVGWLAVGTADASAAWNNVFQVCCHGCRSQGSSSFFAPAAPPSGCPTISYVQRSFCQPVTSYRMQTTTVPVTTYRTSYFMEPVTSYRYVSFYDPCTCSCRQKCEQVTSFRMRSQCNPVVSYVQRCQMVPVTTMRTSFYYEPVVTSAPACPPPCPEPCSDGSQSGVVPQMAPPPALSEQGGGTQPPPALSEQSSNGLLSPQNIPQSIQPAPSRTPARATAPRLDRTASYNTTVPRIQGRLVLEDRFTPRPMGEIVFVNASQSATRQRVQADAAGQFQVTLPQGEWWIYLPSNDGRTLYHSSLQLQAGDDRVVTVVSR